MARVELTSRKVLAQGMRKVEAGHHRRVLVLEATLQRGLRRVREERTSNSKKDLAHDEAHRAITRRRSAMSDQEAKCNHVDYYPKSNDRANQNIYGEKALDPSGRIYNKVERDDQHSV
ncbi:uncharacterized protein ATNIH1004_009384 [Aspergillus tanneri]|uniref:Uncharacterized protein n=1 Tax=Aspergillus tanneri TaxID=1220188 RepID=A0A5M9MRI1_9EURO|nr:uncharacterized protein ATNIH1004_009384 [Aspergillus tanneri]KAA8645167.1 hypothetical protein ATNIH1004_009384 [Aspergillus tanneri]